MILAKEDVIVPIYLGIDYSVLEEGDLYFSCIHNLILFAESHGYSKIKFGQTSYLAKAYAGSVFEDLFLGAYANNVFLHQILRIFNKVIFTAPSIPRLRVYRDDAQLILRKILMENNIQPSL